MPFDRLLNFPSLVFALSVALLWVSVSIGTSFRKRWTLAEDEREGFGLILTSTLTLLALIVGFSFSMAISRYDQRKNYEEEEANAIGTEYVRAGLLPVADAAKITGLLKTYLDQRILFYETRDPRQLQHVNTYTEQLQNQLWGAVRGPALVQPTPVTALVVSGMNDVLNRQGYTQAAWWNRIPISAWGLMAIIAICCNLMIGYGARGSKWRASLSIVQPLVISISFLLIADIDSPRGGLIRVRPQNLLSLSQSLHMQ
jgi:hypothetical protein